MSGRHVLLDGRIVPESGSAAFWSLPSVRRGLGVFETIRIAARKPSLAGYHAMRLTAGAARMGITAWLHPRSLARSLARLVIMEEIDEGVLRLFLIAGEDADTAGAPVGRPEGASPNPRGRYLATAASGLPPPLSEARAVLATDLRDPASPLVGVKTLSYGAETLLLRSAREGGADEALRRNLAGRLTEGTWSNLFLVEGERLVTPPASEGLLCGITRWVVCRSAPEWGFTPVEECVTVERLLSSGEAFLTSSLRGAVPLIALDGRTIGTGRPGPATLRIARLLESRTTGQPARGPAGIEHPEDS